MSNLFEQERQEQEGTRITVDEVANDVGISHGTAFAILNENLALSKLSARRVTKALSEDQLHQRTDLSLTILNRIEADEDDFFERCVNGDETWIYQKRGMLRELLDPLN